MFNLLARSSGLELAEALLDGHRRWVERNTGTTVDAHLQHFIQNPQGVLSNNRHFIADTMMEYQPNGDGTTEGQALHILGYCHAYLATGEQFYLDKAIWHWNAYVQYFYAGQPIPDTPQRWICNWLVNAKEPVLANFPINPVEPTQGGYKCVPLQFVDGEAQIPHGAPFWGEYLDVATFAHRGHPAWGSINASVQKIVENTAGQIDWDTVFASYRVTSMPVEPWEATVWIDWPTYLGKPYYSIDWSSSGEEVTYPINWMVAWTGNKIGTGPGPFDQLWDGDIIETGLAASEKGKIKLQDTTLNGVYLINYAVKLPVELGGYQFERNEPWHNRPINTPFLGSANQLGNAADAEVWFIDACYLLWRITGEPAYKQALDAVFFTAHEYTHIDSADSFFRQSKAANTPFTDGISYSFSYPGNVAVTYARDDDGYLNVKAAASCQHFLEQQAVWFRIDRNAKLRVTYGGRSASNGSIGCKAMLDINPVKAESPTQTWFGVTLPKTNNPVPQQYDIPVGSLAKLTNDATGEDYMVADARAVTDYGGCTWQEQYEASVLDGRPATVIQAVFPTSSAGFIIGFWLNEGGRAPLNSIVYRSDAPVDVRIVDDNLWRWYWILPNTNGTWATFTFDPAMAHLSGYQPSHPSSDPRPTSPVYTTFDQVTVLLENSGDTNKHFGYYCVNDVPPLFDAQEGWTLTYRMVLIGSEAFDARVGDCTIEDFRLDSLAYCPGVIPFSNIYGEGSDQIGAWHGMPYPGYQYPVMYCLQADDRYATWLDNQIDFLYDSQEAYFQQVGVMGPGCAAYIWNRWDNYTYGPADTWTTFHWGNKKPWSGYQSRAFNAAARAWYELSLRGKPVPAKLQIYVERWITWLAQFAKSHGGLPYNFPSAPDVPAWTKWDFTGHMCGLWLAGSCYAALAGCQVSELDELIETTLGELAANYDITPYPGHAMNGCWSPSLRLGTDNGMAFGFYTGEIFRGLGLYLLYRRHGAGHNIFRAAALADAADASL